MKRLKLGERYRDTISGFEGVATGRCEYFNGCIQIQLSGGDGKPESHWFDEQNIEGVATRARAGGPQSAPPLRQP